MYTPNERDRSLRRQGDIHALAEVHRRPGEHPELRAPYAMIRNCLARNGGILPVGLNGAVPGFNGNLWYDPLKRWGSQEDPAGHMHKKNLLGICTRRT